jgi:hypothetical protein
MTPEQEAWQQVLDETLAAQLHHYYKEVAKIKGEAMMYDPQGNTAFITIAFNHPVNPDLLPDDASSSDLSVALASASSAIMPDIHANEHGIIGAAETVPHGVQAVAAAMLLSSLQGAMVQVMSAAQQLVLKHRSMN